MKSHVGNLPTRADVDHRTPRFSGIAIRVYGAAGSMSGLGFVSCWGVDTGKAVLVVPESDSFRERSTENASNAAFGAAGKRSRRRATGGFYCDLPATSVVPVVGAPVTFNSRKSIRLSEW